MHPRESTSKLAAALALCGIVLFLTACETEKPAAAPPAPPTPPATPTSAAPAPEGAVKLNAELFLGRPLVVDNVTAWPVFSTQPPAADGGQYITLADAQEQKLAEVRETGALVRAQQNVAQAAQQRVQPQINPPPQAQKQQSDSDQQRDFRQLKQEVEQLRQSMAAQPQAPNPPPQQAQRPVQTAQQMEVAPQGQQSEFAIRRQELRFQMDQREQTGQQVVVFVEFPSRDVGGRVNQLVIENKGAQPILVLAGTLVKGGKQDRQIAQDFIISPGKTVPVDAFCVEHGRWTANREGQATQGQFQAQKTHAEQSVRYSGQIAGNQSQVWEKVSKVNLSAAKNPSTGTLMATVEETDKEALARRGKIRKALLDELAALAKGGQAPVGLAYAIDGKPREVRTFNDPRIFQHYAETLANTIAMEGDLAQRRALAQKQEVYSKTAEVQKVVELVQEVEKLQKEQVDTQAGNVNFYQKGDKRAGGKTFMKGADNKPGAAPVTQTWSAGE
jgi:hypothetical protein